MLNGSVLWLLAGPIADELGTRVGAFDVSGLGVGFLHVTHGVELHNAGDGAPTLYVVAEPGQTQPFAQFVCSSGQVLCSISADGTVEAPIVVRDGANRGRLVLNADGTVRWVAA